MEFRESIDIDLSRYFLAWKRRWFPALCIFLITVSLSAVATKVLFKKSSYQATGKLLFRLERTSSLTRVKTGEEIKDLSPLVATQNPLSTEMEIVNSLPLLKKTIDSLSLKDEKGQALEPNDFKEKLSMKIIGGTDVLHLSYKSRDPKEAAAVVNKLMSLYIENNIITNQTEAAAAREFLTKQIPQTEATARQQEAALRTFKEKNNVVDLAEEARAAVTMISTLDNQITSAKAELDKVTAQSTALSNKLGLNSQEAMAVSSLSQSTAVQGVLRELQGVETQLAAQRSRFQEQNPTIVSLEEKRASLQTLLQEQTKQVLGSQTQVPEALLQIGELKQNLIKEFVASEVQRLTLARGLASLYNSRSVYQQRANILPQLAQQQQDLERKQETAQSTYKTLLQNLQEAQLAENKKTSNARIIEPAPVPEKPLPTPKVPVLLLGVMLGAFLSTTTVLLLEMSDRSIKTLKEVKELFQYPLLGVIPLFDKKALYRNRDGKLTPPEIYIRDAPYSMVSEIYRMIQANLKFISPDKELKIITVTSSVSQEGKSKISANLAAAIAQLGRRVLLIDANMRYPSQHHIWGLSNAAGLSEVIVGKAEFRAAACEVMDDLDVLTSGVMPPNPLALLSSKRTASIMKDFSEKYDFVIIDAPPLMPTADTLTLSQMTDGILLVARLEAVDSASIHSAKEMLERSGQNVLGLVVNGAIQKNISLAKTVEF
jgi:capsular exopolysaccharide synthesis family protein